MFLHEDKAQFKEAIELTVFKTGLEPAVIEKDYYVTIILKLLSEKFDFVVFKGGTSLQKCHKAISRFSEDIDISVDIRLSQSQKRKLKSGIADISQELGMPVINLEDIRSRMDYNRYEMAYATVLDKAAPTIKTSILLETSFTEISFPTMTLPVHGYISDMFATEAPTMTAQYGLDLFIMKVQGLDRTLVDKVFAVCDYYLQGKTKFHSRHIYDIYKLLPLVPQDENFRALVNEVRKVRSTKNICPSAKPGVDIPAVLSQIVNSEAYKTDYNVLTLKLLEDSIRYEEAISSLKHIASGHMFDS